MPLTSFGFVVKGAGYSSSDHSAILQSANFKTLVVCVSDIEDAKSTVANMVREGVQIVELCGGFTEKEATSLRQHIRDVVPIGRVTYTPLEEKRLAQLFG